MTNPDNSVGTNAAYGGRTSVNAFNDDLSAYSRGIMSGWDCTPDGGLAVSLGGNGTDRDVAVAEDNVGNKTSINNISGAPIKLTMAAAPGSGTRLDSIVAYVDASPQGSATITDNYEACGLIIVQGTPSSSPTAPTDNDIRSAITSDGASGPTAYYVVLATITMASGTTDITTGEITAGLNAMIQARNIDLSTLGGNYSVTEQITGCTWIDGKTIYKKTIYFGALPNSATKNVSHGISNLSQVILIEGIASRPSDGTFFQINNSPHPSVGLETSINITINSSDLTIATGTNRSDMAAYITLYYTKSS